MKLIMLAAVSLSLLAVHSAVAEDEREEAPRNVKLHGEGPHGGQTRQFNPNADVQHGQGNPHRQFNGPQQFRHTPVNVIANLPPRLHNQPDLSRRVVAEPRVNPNITLAPPIAPQTAEVVPGRRWRNGGSERPGLGVNRGNWRGHNNGGDGEWRNRVDDGGEVNRSQNWAGRGHGHWDRSRRDRTWWTSHYNRFARFGGGYYYLNSGYWYPAYGYDPYFTTYTYDAPIYAYNDQEPGEVIANVQAELQRRGYNAGGVDGTYGPQTRRALLNYQSDTGLATTGEIDEQTLDSLGLQ